MRTVTSPSIRSASADTARRYLILSSFERRSGGQSCVQFVRHARTNREFAVKFFHNSDVFHREARLYSNPKLRYMMAATHEVCASCSSA